MGHYSTITAQNSSAAVEEITADPCTVICVKGFIHNAQVHEDAVPVQQKQRCLPFAVRQAVSDELSTLLKDGIIKQINALQWVSPIVVTTKKEGQIKPCVYLREPNNALIVDKHPLLHMENF